MPKYKYVTGASIDEDVTELEIKNRKIAYKAACEGIVLLKNDNNVLPLNTGKIALFGAGASRTVKGGTGSGEVNERYTVSILEGLENAGFTVTTKKWINDFEDELQRSIDQYAERMKKTSILKFKDVINIMNDPMMLPYGRLIDEQDIAESDTDTAIYVVARQAGEGTDKKLDKGEFDLSELEKENLKILSDHYRKVILIINSGSQMDLSILDSIRIDAVIFFCQQGEEGGNALADILSGKINPSGKLTDTWAKQYSDIPFAYEYSYLNDDLDHEYYKEGIYIGYRYFDSFYKEVRYPFGFGLSYTDFSVEVKDVQRTDNRLLFTVKVSNTGEYAGREVVQLYVSAPRGRLKKELKRLISFEKTRELKPNEEELIKLTAELSDCTSYDEDNKAYVLEKGDYLFLIGDSSSNVSPAVKMILDNDVDLRSVRSICPSERKIQELEAEYTELKYDDIPFTVKARAEDLETEKVVYGSVKKKAIDQLSALTEKEMAALCVGQGMGGMMKADKIAALGCIGKTTDSLYKKGILGVNLSDGPAGIRLCKTAAIRKNGSLKMGEFFMSFMNFFPEFLKKRMLLDPKKDKPLYQYCTAFPVGTSIAQTWSKALAEEVGKALSEEMKKYLLTYWLAPAMNIHRNPLCGRNFEYYSEDPYLSGMTGASVVKGVQKEEGIYATIKHFAANNAEENRNHSDSIMDERTLREIYLKGFEICIREAKPKAVMSSYNKINGVHTANCRDLLTLVLRDEWGFDGVVMTDWYATQKDQAAADLAIAAGNDLIMPGMPSDSKTILKGLNNGRVSKSELESSVSRILKEINDSNIAKQYDPKDFI